MTTGSKRLLVAIVALVALGATFWFVTRSRHSPRIIYDYASGAAGRVVDRSGRPVADATVTMTFDRTVFEAVTPRRRTRVATDQLGRFEAVLISCGRPGAGYTVMVEKSGFFSARVRGSGAGFHRIVLTAASPSSPQL